MEGGILSMQVSPCNWVPDFTGCTSGPCCPDVDATENAAVKVLAASVAQDLLWALTGRRYGCCEVTVRPCQLGSCCTTDLTDIIYWDQRFRDGRAGNLGVLSYFPTLIRGEVVNIGCGVCGTGCCTCCPECHVILPGPVCGITRVVVNGRDVGQSQFQVYNHNELAFTTIGRTVLVETPGPSTPAPLIHDDANPTSQAFGQFGASMSLDTIGASYEFTTPESKDISFVIEIPEGNGPTEFHVFQPIGFDVIALSGAPSSLVVNGNDVQVGFATLPEPLRLLIRAPKGWNSNDITIKQDTGNFPIRLVEVTWTDPTTGTGGCPTNRQVDHRNVPGPATCCNFATSHYTDVGNGGLHCFDQPAAGTCEIPAGTWKVTAGGNTAPYVGSMLASFSDGQKLFEQPGAWTCGNYGTVAAPISNSGIFTFATAVTATLFFEQDNGEGVAHPITNPFICYAAPDTVVTSGANCQDYSKANGEVGTWSVTYTIGEPVPAELNLAAGMLACEIAKSLLGQSCALPSRVQNVARQGIDVSFFDPIAFTNEGLTGIPFVDMVIRALNPYRMAQASYVWSPDLPKTRWET